MKCSKASIHRKTHRIPEIRFEDQGLTSFAGLILFQALFNRLGLKEQLTGCFQHLKVSPIFGHGLTVLLLIVHLLLGYRRLQDMRYYQDDPIVRRLLGLQRLPDVATVSRTLAGMDARSVDRLRRLNRQQVLQRLSSLNLARITLDFDGSVLSTGRFAEGTAVGFNRKKKGQRSYYRKQHKEPVQLDLFIPYEYGYDFKVIVTNKRIHARKLLAYHNGRGAQEGVFAELKSQTQMDYIPTRRQAGNQVFVLSAMLAHNLNREMQMMADTQQRHTTEKRAPPWHFEQLGTLRRKLIQRAGRLTKPQGALTLAMSGNQAVKSELLHYLDVLKKAA